MPPLPPLDHELSPHTGWTRAHWEAVADHLVDGMLRFRSPEGALILPPGRISCSGSLSDGLEGFARSFLLAAPRVAGAGGADARGWLTAYAEGLDAGTGDGAERWPAVVDRAQPLVEAASLAISLHLTRPWLWDRLDDGVRQRVVRWLRPGLTVEHVDNNWWLFPVLVAEFLDAVGAGSAEGDAAIARGLERVESFHAGGGWYSDGPNRSFDYYNGWAMHFYLGLRAWVFGRPAGPELRTRLRAFLADHAAFFDPGGGMVYFGRSMTYRFASLAPLWLGAALDCSPLPPGHTRATASAVLRRFLDRGAAAGGLLSTGWYGPHEPTLQEYSGAASPYWAAKGFFGLLLPPAHPVWSAREESGEPAQTSVAAPGFVLDGTGGVARLSNHGSHHHPGDPLYLRFHYSSRTGPTAVGDTPDNDFALWSEGAWTSRDTIEPLGTGPGWAASRHAAATAVIDSVTLVRDGIEVRVHVIDRPGRCRQTGWAVAGDEVAADLIALIGFDTADTLPVPAGTAFGAPAAVAAVEGTSDLFASASALWLATGTRPPLDLVRADRAAGGLVVHWPDGGASRVDFTGQVSVHSVQI